MGDIRFALGVDIGGGSTKIALVSSDGVVVDREHLASRSNEDGDAIVARYGDAIDSLLRRNRMRKPIGIGVGFPGNVFPDKRSGSVGNVFTLNDFPLAQRLTQRTALPVRLENDASAAALAEVTFGAGKNAERLMMVTLGTGIGVALIVNGKPFSTVGGCLGDPGHTIVDPASSNRCRHGCLGCLETVASGEALGRMLADHVGQKADGPLARRCAEEGRPMDASSVVVCASEGDPDAAAMLSRAGGWIGIAVASWCHIFAPTMVLIGGGLSAAGNILLQPLEDGARRHGMPHYMRQVRFAPASLGNDAGMIGAATSMLLNFRTEELV